MRIGVVVPGFHASPDEPFVPYWGDLVRRLAVRAEVTVFALRRPQIGYDYHGASVVAVGCGNPRLRASARLWLRAVRIVAREARLRELALLHSLHANEAGAVAAAAALCADIPSLVHVGGGELTNLPDIGYGSGGVPAERIAVGLAFGLASAITVGSLATAAAANGMPLLAGQRPPVLRVPFGVDTDQFVPTHQAEPNALVHVADMNPVKDQMTLVAALALLARDRDVTLHWVGDGPASGRLRTFARALAVDGRIRWWGRIPHSAVPLVMARGAAFVLSSRHEAQGVVLAEAACAGLPIASTAVGIAPELPASAVHLVRERDPSALAAAMRSALDTGAEPRAALRRAAVARFGVDAVDRRIDLAHRRVLPKSHPASDSPSGIQGG